jgi:hypothetical protein
MPASAASLQVRQLAQAPALDGEVVQSCLDQEGNLQYVVTLLGDRYLWRYPGVADFVVWRDRPVIGWWPNGGKEADICALAGGPVIGFALQLHGLTALHAITVVRDGRAIVVAAPSGFGKSTLAAALLQQGCSFLSDDITAIEIEDGRPSVLPSVPQLKLRADSAEAFLEDSQRDYLPLHLSFSDKYVVTPEALGQVWPQPVPLHAVFILAPVLPNGSVEVTRLNGSESLLVLLANVYRRELLTRESAVQARQLEVFSQVAQGTPVYAVTSPRRLDAVRSVAAAILLVS